MGTLAAHQIWMKHEVAQPATTARLVRIFLFMALARFGSSGFAKKGQPGTAGFNVNVTIVATDYTLLAASKVRKAKS